MKSLIKTVILPIAIALVGFTVLNAQAASNNDQRPLIHQQSQHFIFFTVPNFYSEGRSPLTSQHLISNMAKSIEEDNTLAITQPQRSVPTSTCNSKKVNHVYELTTLFNDKLQVLLSYLSPHKNERFIEEKSEDKNSINVAFTNKK